MGKLFDWLSAAFALRAQASQIEDRILNSTERSAQIKEKGLEPKMGYLGKTEISKIS